MNIWRGRVLWQDMYIPIPIPIPNCKSRRFSIPNWKSWEFSIPNQCRNFPSIRGRVRTIPTKTSLFAISNLEQSRYSFRKFNPTPITFLPFATTLFQFTKILLMPRYTQWLKVVKNVIDRRTHQPLFLF